MPSLNRLQKPVLVLNASYEPINICAARRALVLVLKGVAAAVEPVVMTSSTSRMRLPDTGCRRTGAKAAVTFLRRPVLLSPVWAGV